MAGSRRSPGLRDERRISQGPRDSSGRGRDLARGRGRGRGRVSEQDRGRSKHRGRYRPGPNHRSRSPPSSRVGSVFEDISRHRESPLGSSGPSQELPPNTRRPSFSSYRSFADRDTPRVQEAKDYLAGRSQGRDDAVVENISQRGRSHSPRAPRRDRNRKNRNAGRHARGKPPQRGKPSQRERFRDRNFQPHPYDSGWPESGAGYRGDTEEIVHDTHSTYQRSISPTSAQEDYKKGEISNQPFESRRSRPSLSISPNRDDRMSSNFFHPEATEPRRSPSVSRSTFALDAEPSDHNGSSHTSESFSRRGMMNAKQRSNSRHPPSHSRGDNRQYSPPRFATSTNSYHGSPEPGSPHHTSSHHTSEGRSQAQNYSSMSATHSNTPQRGGHHRGGYQDRRFSNHGAAGFNGSGSHRGRGHFNNLQWVASGPRDRLEQQDSPTFHSGSGSNTPQYQHSHSNAEPPFETSQDHVHRFSDDAHMADSQSKPNSENGGTQNMPPPAREPNSTSATPAKEGGKFSFAFKSKATPAPATKPVPDLAQRMQSREPPRGPALSSRAPESSPRNRLSGPPPPPNYKQDYRLDRRDRDREFHRGRGREDRRDFHGRNPRDQRREDRRFDPREARRRDDHRTNFRNERRRDKSPEPKRQKRIIKRVKPRAVLPEEFRDSDSVYFRKPGDESVIGAGTYGKVFKAIHIYTQDKVALKRIRMEGEKDGFPVTAVREIKLLQHLRHENIVSLLEVMVEKNECFMVFEYLSHDLTGLINHPTFTLTDSHKKDLAKQMFGGLQYLHHRGVLHRDIKAANILISNRGQLKYADFGLARFFSKSRQLDYTNRVITIWYRPPELLLGDTRYGPAVDIWSAACVFMEMFTKKAIFPGDGKELSQLNKLYGSLGTPTRTDWPGIDEMPWVELMGPTERKKRVFEDTYRDFISPGALDLVCQIFQYDPSKRPTADEVLAHAYFTAEEPGPQQATELVLLLFLSLLYILIIMATGSRTSRVTGMSLSRKHYARNAIEKLAETRKGKGKEKEKEKNEERARVLLRRQNETPNGNVKRVVTVARRTMHDGLGISVGSIVINAYIVASYMNVLACHEGTWLEVRTVCVYVGTRDPKPSMPRDCIIWPDQSHNLTWPTLILACLALTTICNDV